MLYIHLWRPWGFVSVTLGLTLSVLLVSGELVTHLLRMTGPPLDLAPLSDEALEQAALLENPTLQLQVLLPPPRQGHANDLARPR